MSDAFLWKMSLVVLHFWVLASFLVLEVCYRSHSAVDAAARDGPGAPVIEHVCKALWGGLPARGLPSSHALDFHIKGIIEGELREQGFLALGNCFFAKSPAAEHNQSRCVMWCRRRIVFALWVVSCGVMGVLVLQSEGPKVM